MTLRQRIMYDEIEPGTQCCENCRHFYRHYVAASQSPTFATPTFAGHCVYPRIKMRMVTDVCQHFENKNENKNDT